MKTHPHPRWSTGLLALVLACSITACDSLTGAPPDAADAAEDLVAMTSYLSDELSLSSVQSESLGETARRNQDSLREPGGLWRLAAELQATLTAEQKQRLFDLLARLEGQGDPRRPGDMGPGGRPGGPQGRPGDGSRPHDDVLDSLLTEAQRSELEAIRARYEAQLRALREARRDGTIDDETFRTQAQALHEAMKAALDAVLTDEQRAALEARRAAREAERQARAEQERAVMIEVLGLTDAQVAALDALRDAHEAERQAIREQAEAGTLTPDEVRDLLEAQREAHQAALEALLDDRQFEIVRIHEALRTARPMFAGGGPGGGKGPAGRRPGGGNG